jgi:hypothetical protein
MHHDARRSAVINFDEGLWYCNAGCGGGTLKDLLDEQEQWVDPPKGHSRNPGSEIRKSGVKPADLPSEATIAGWHAALLGDPVLLGDLMDARGLWVGTIRYHQIGWDAGARAYTIPVRDLDGKLLNVRRYQLRPPEGRRKIWGVNGHNLPRLFPAKTVAKLKTYAIVCEGEWDALITNQHNFRAVTKTGSAGAAWRSDWTKLLKEAGVTTVYVCHDADAAGQAANRKVARSLIRDGIEDVRIIRLPYPITEKHGRDLTDWWLDHDLDVNAFQRLLDEATPFDESMAEDPEEIAPDAASVTDAFDSRRSGRPLALTVTVKGRREPGYSVPRRVEYRCTQDAGKQCAICPMKANDGAMDRVVAGADPQILEMVDSTRLQLGELLRRTAGIPKCPKLRTKVVEHQAVEILFARPSVEHANGASADYKNIKLTSVGRHDTSPNQTVQVVGALHPDPRKQLNEFLTWDVSTLETSLDRFELDAETARLLRIFRPRSGQPPLKKVREIADDLAEHVTMIYGRPELHAVMDLVFHSVVSFTFDGKVLSRGWIEALVIGDTRTGKSEAATRLARHYSAGEVVSCESASYAGIVGGLQQFGATKEWAVTWGAVPLNDRRLVVLDEISGLSPEDIGAMSSIRSSGVAELTKIQQERTYARTRLIWIGNPRNAKMSDYTYGVQAIRPLIGNPEDIARFDLAMSVASGDVPSSAINRSRPRAPQKYPREAASALVRWAWSRTAEDVEWDDGAEAAVYVAAERLGATYVEDPPLIQAANVREKVARLAVAIAARTFSTDDRGERLIVRREHVLAARQFIDAVYGMKGFGYRERSREIIEDGRVAEQNVSKAQRFLDNKPGLSKFLRSQGKFRRQDLEEILDIDREEANAIISQLYELRMIYKDKGDVRLSPTLHRLLREAK